MWWIIGFVIAGIYGIALKILESLRQEVAVERKRWEDSYQQVQAQVYQQQRIIEQQLQTAIDLLDYKKLSDLHSASIKIADITHGLLQDSRKTLDAMGRAIVNTAINRKELEQRKRNAWPWEAGSIEKEIVSLHKLRDEILVPDKDKVKSQRNHLLAEVRSLNRQTAQLRDLKEAVRQRNVAIAQERRPYQIPAQARRADIYITCKDCRNSFVFSGGEQEFFLQKGLQNPIRCPNCRAARKR